MSTKKILLLTIALFIVFIVSLWSPLREAVNDSIKRSKDIAEIREDGKRSPAHQFVADKFLACESRGFISPGKDACVAQVIQLSKLNGPEFEKNVLLAIKDMGLN